MKKLSRVLHSERGDFFVGSLVSLIIVALVISSSAAFLLVAGKASLASSHVTTRTIGLNTVLSDELPRALSFTSDPVQLDTPDGTVNIWREDTAAGSALHASTDRHNAAGTCAEDHLAPSCITVQVPVRDARTAAALELAEGTGDDLYTVQIPAGTTAVQYLFEVTAADEDSTVVFSRSGSDKELAVEVSAGAVGYYHGRILTEPGSTLTVKVTGGARLSPEKFIIEVTDAP